MCVFSIKSGLLLNQKFNKNIEKARMSISNLPIKEKKGWFWSHSDYLVHQLLEWNQNLVRLHLILTF